MRCRFALFFFNTKAIFTNRLTLLNHGKECSLNSADCCSAVFIYQDAVVVTTFYLPPGPVLLSLANRASTASSSAPWVFRASALTAQLKPISWNHTNIPTLKPRMITLLAQHIHTHTHRQVTLVYPKKSFSYKSVGGKPMNQTFVLSHFHFCKASPTMRCSVCARFSSCAASALVLSSLRTSL